METERTHQIMRKQTSELRQEAKNKAMAQRRFGIEDCDEAEQNYSLDTILTHCKSNRFADIKWLERLKKSLASGEVNPDDFFRGSDGSNNLHSLANVISGGHGDTACQLMAVHCAANLGPLAEKYGLQMARSAGPYLVTLLSSSSPRLAEAAAIALGNLALAGFRVAKVLVNQETVQTLSQHLTTSSKKDEKVLAADLYALYHILHALIAEENFAIDELETVTDKCIALLMTNGEEKAPVELFWLLFLLSCDPNQHDKLSKDSVINACLDTCTYEIFQKSDPRPLVKVVTPLVRMMANLCGGPAASETVCLSVLRHPDVTAIMMALLGTNYTHLCRESLWWFSNIINNESVIVQEQFVELNIMDKLEYHTVQAVQKLDPYANVIL
jgi:hypothetical protein